MNAATTFFERIRASLTRSVAVAKVARDIEAHDTGPLISKERELLECVEELEAELAQASAVLALTKSNLIAARKERQL
jgi:hypothetical protein